MKITFEDYDIMQEQLEELPNRSPAWLPSEEDLNTYVMTKPEKFIEFLLWLTFTAKPDTDESRIHMRAINRILYDKIIFLD